MRTFNRSRHGRWPPASVGRWSHQQTAPPRCAHPIWKAHADKKSQESAFPAEKPRTEKAHWGDNLARKIRDKIPEFPGTHAWREIANPQKLSGVALRKTRQCRGQPQRTSPIIGTWRWKRPLKTRHIKSQLIAMKCPALLIKTGMTSEI